MTGAKGKDWHWDQTPWGHHGVHTFEGHLVWYTHSHNPHGANAGSVQSFEDFVASGQSAGPSAPEEVLSELLDWLRDRERA